MRPSSGNERLIADRPRFAAARPRAQGPVNFRSPGRSVHHKQQLARSEQGRHAARCGTAGGAASGGRPSLISIRPASAAAMTSCHGLTSTDRDDPAAFSVSASKMRRATGESLGRRSGVDLAEAEPGRITAARRTRCPRSRFDFERGHPMPGRTQSVRGMTRELVGYFLPRYSTCALCES